jgi:RNA polymerase sigma factor (sigma-70 family)
MSGTDGAGSSHGVFELTALVRRVVTNRVQDRESADEIVQETIARLLAAGRRLDDSAAGPYAIVTARNLIASQWRRNSTHQRHEHRLFDPRGAHEPEDSIVEQEEAAAVRAALDRLHPRERDVLVAHEVAGQDTKSLAEEIGSTPGAVAAQLNRSRAKLRVEYLLELHGDPPSRQCRPVLLALSAGDRRRQDAVDAGYHILDCEFCALLSEPLFDRRPSPAPEEATTVLRADSDIVTARRRGRELALEIGFSPTEATVIATAISEVARNIVRFATSGDVTVTRITEGDATGVLVVARDTGPGIADLDQAMSVGYTTYGGRGLGLPGARRLMDEFEITSEFDCGTTVTMTKWHRR